MNANNPTGSIAPSRTQPSTTRMSPDIAGSVPPTARPESIRTAAPSVKAEAAAPPIAPNTVEHWTNEINCALGFSTGWVKKAGQLLLAAKKQLLHGQWMAMFAGGKLKLKLRKAEMLMAIAKNPVFTKKEYWSNLPRAWTTLYALSKLPREALEQAIQHGVVHPGLKLAEARCLLPSAQTKAPADLAPPARPPFNLARQQARLLHYLRRQATRWPPAQRETLAALLERVASELRGEEKAL